MNTSNTNNRPSRSKSSMNRRGPSGSSRFSSNTPSNRGRFQNGPTSRNGGGSRGGYRSSGGSRGGSRGGGRKMPSFDPSKFINTNPIEVEQEVYESKHTFADFGFNQKLVDTVTSRGLITPSPIQDQIIPEILKGHDVIGLAETGTGKTAAFLLPLIEKTSKEVSRQTLILTPTRELAIQIEEELRNLSKGFNIYSVTCVGGMNIHPQLKALRRINQFIIGTPGRVLDLINRRSIKPENLRTVVLDEADRMLDMGFINDMKKILSATPKDRETLFFSATMSTETEKLVHEFLNKPVTVSVKKKDVTDSIKQDVVRSDQGNKFETLTNLLKKPDFSRVIIFGAMKHSVEKLSQQLTASGFKSESIHGNKSHSQRQRSLQKFKKGESQILVATDVAARGIHVDEVSHVINYDLPQTFEDYVHRIGRTGRGTKRGMALTFISK